MEKQIKNRSEDKKNRTLYSKEKVPVNTKNSINEEIEKMKKFIDYNKRTQ